MPLRIEVAQGYIARTTIGGLFDHAASHWIVCGPEAHDIVRCRGHLYCAFCNELHVLNENGGHEVTIQDSGFSNLHSIACNPCDRHVLLLSNPGLDNIIEYDIVRRQVRWSWSPLDCGMRKNYFGINVMDHEEEFMPGPSKTLLSRAKAIKKMNAGTLNVADEEFFCFRDKRPLAHPLGYEKWQRVGEPNWAAYANSGQDIYIYHCFLEEQSASLIKQRRS